MSIIAWIVIGLIAGVLAKWAMPGASNEPSGWIGTTLLGIVGAVLGGWIWNFFLAKPGATGIDIGSVFVALCRFRRRVVYHAGGAAPDGLIPTASPSARVEKDVS